MQALAKAYIPGVGAYKGNLDIYKQRPQLIFAQNEKRKGPIDKAIEESKKNPGAGEYFK